MKLIELELTNIKSYEHEVIRFSEGINCILGLNGGGKTTIIESVGNVLFNSGVKTNNSLIRFNKNRGEIGLVFEGNDNHIYKITKIIKRDQACPIKLYDYENNQLLQEQTSNVYPFIRKILNIPEEKNLAKMFEEIIAIPQGLFVNAFLTTPSKRKENFDKLFELDIYTKTADELKKLSDAVQFDYIVVLEKEIASLNGKVNNYENVIEQIKELDIKISVDKELSKNYIIELEKLSKEKEKLDEKVKLIEDIKLKLKEANIKKQNLEETLKINSDNLNNAKEAEKILKENEFAFFTYQKNSIELKQNEEKYEKFLSITEKQKENSITISKLTEANVILKPLLHDLKVDLGMKRQTVIDKTEEIKKKQEENTSLERSLSPIKEEIKTENQKSTQFKATYTFYLDKLKTINEYLLSYNRSENFDLLDSKILEMIEKIKEIEENKKELIELDKEKARLTSDIENLNLNHNYINDGCCPILKQKCLNIKGSNLSTEVDKMLEEKQNSLRQINASINNLISLNKDEELILREIDFIKIKKANEEKSHDKYLSVLDDLRVTFKEDNLEINEDNVKVVVSNLIKKYQDLNENYKNERYEELKQQENEINKQLHSNEAQILINKKNIIDLNNEIQKTQENLESKTNQYNINDFEINKAKEENKKIELSLQEFQGIKEKIEDNKAVINKLQSHYEIYISKQNEASNKGKYELIVNDCKEKININEQNINIYSENINKLEQEFSLVEYQRIVKDLEKVKSDKVSCDTRIIMNSNTLNSLQEDKKKHDLWFEEISKLQEKLEKYQKLNDQYKIYRTIFSNLPRELSKRIRKYIGMYSSSLYRGISNENVRIELEDDYEVILIDCEDKERSKTLSQLSGGEQMSVAISIRLAMLKQITNVEFYFMDEPTINLDYKRRVKVAEVVKDISSNLRQLFVISHDDTFETITDNTIKIIKENNSSVIEN